MTSHVDITGRLIITVRDAQTHDVVDVVASNNLVVLTGRNLVRDLLTNATSARVTHFAVGTSSTAATATDTALGNEVARDLITQTTASSGQILFRYFLPSTAANGVTLQEAGLHTASTGGVMFARVTYAGIAKSASISVTYDWTTTIGAS